MKKRIIKINNNSSVPKYKQIIQSVIHAIERKSVVKGDKIPSINQVCDNFHLSRDTVMLAFNELKAKGILISQAGKGYYIAKTEINADEKIFVLFDELNAFKEDLYNSLVNSLRGKAIIEVYFHHFNFKVYKNLIQESIGNYTSYIIMPATFENTSHLLTKIPRDKIFILDRLKPDLKNYPVVYQNFDLDFYDALVAGLTLIKKYRRLVFVNPLGKEPAERNTAFERFCGEFKFIFKIVKSFDDINLGFYDVFFLISDSDLVELVKKANHYGYILGYNFGIVSFNDIMLKEIVAGGITTISTDFAEMGKTLSNMVLTRKPGQVRNSSKLIIRQSL